MKPSQSPVVTEFENMLPWYMVYALGITRISSGVPPLVKARSAAAVMVLPLAKEPRESGPNQPISELV